MIEELSTDWDPQSYDDCYRKRLEKVIERKRRGAKIEAPEPEPGPKPAPDLMEALEATLANVRDGRDARAARDQNGDLGDLSRDELYERAQREGVSGRSKMSREELIEALGD